MTRHLLTAAALLAAASCMSDSGTAPVARGATASSDRVNLMHELPGSQLTDAVISGKLQPLNCIPTSSSEGTAIIGPTGGTLTVGTHRLIVPAGALDEEIEISGTIPEGLPFQIDLQPHGLQFRKAAGLILDASSCLSVPDIVYLIDQTTISEPIEATYSTWWMTIACPIWHFSGYAIALGDGAAVSGEGK